jgi:hypothetical protein
MGSQGRSWGEWVERVLHNVCYALTNSPREALLRVKKVARAAVPSSVDERERESAGKPQSPSASGPEPDHYSDDATTDRDPGGRSGPDFLTFNLNLSRVYGVRKYTNPLAPPCQR